MRIQNEAQVNEVPTSNEALLKKLKKVEEENRQLRIKLSDAKHLEKEKVVYVPVVVDVHSNFMGLNSCKRERNCSSFCKASGLQLACEGLSWMLLY